MNHYGDYGVKFEPGYRPESATRITGKRLFWTDPEALGYRSITRLLTESEVTSYALDQEGRDYAIIEFIDEDTDMSLFEVAIHKSIYKNDILDTREAT